MDRRMIKTRHPTAKEAAEYIRKMNSAEQSRVQKEAWRQELGEEFVKRVGSELKKK